MSAAEAAPVIVIDAGNSSTTTALYHRGVVTQERRLRGGALGMPEACGEALRMYAASGAVGAIVASVVPAADELWRELTARECGFQPYFLTHRSRLPMRLDYDNPETTGADRLANVAGALARYGAPLLVLDIGTAVTYELVSEDRRLFTGAIGPGPDIMARALADYTALLPLVEWWRHPAPELPKNTTGAIEFGIEAAFLGALRETLARLLNLCAGTPRIVATGGYAARFAQPLDLDITVDQELTVFGLGWLYHYQQELTNEK